MDDFFPRIYQEYMISLLNPHGGYLRFGGIKTV